MTDILADQLTFRPPLPDIYGCKDYREQRELVIRIDELLEANDTDLKFQKICLEQYDKWIGEAKTTEEDAGDTDEETWSPNYNPYSSSGKLKQSWLNHCKVALRANIYRYLSNSSNRALSVKLADSALVRWFCQVGEFGPVKPPAKSTVNRYEHWIDTDSIHQIITGIIQQAGAIDDAPQENPFDLSEAINLIDAWLDGTCLKANIHFPVDWILLRDICRTLMKATILIRKQGLKNRMPQAPEGFLRDMNKLVIKMTQCRRKAGAKKLRKAVIREITNMEKRVTEHARKHRDILEKRWGETDLSKAQAEEIIRRIDHILEQVPAAIEQARERIIGERQIASIDKILSIYETNINVLVRSKADAEVEFGNTLRLTEQCDGVIIDFKLYRDPVTDNSSGPFRENMESLDEVTKGKISNLHTDRGFDSEANISVLKEFGIENGICPKSPAELKKKMSDPDYATAQRRRGSTEARISIYKNRILGGLLRSKGFQNRKRAVAWAVLAHNLWVIARLPRKKVATEAESSDPALKVA